jgi:hypothetical protein
MGWKGKEKFSTAIMITIVARECKEGHKFDHLIAHE